VNGCFLLNNPMPVHLLLVYPSQIAMVAQMQMVTHGQTLAKIGRQLKEQMLSLPNLHNGETEILTAMGTIKQLGRYSSMTSQITQRNSETLITTDGVIIKPMGRHRSMISQ
jgi:hypothetical protein